MSHVLPVSDDGGSTAEIVRVIGGPAVGDIRSRCLRLADDRDEEVGAPVSVTKHLLCICNLHMRFTGLLAAACSRPRFIVAEVTLLLAAPVSGSDVEEGLGGGARS